MNGEIKSSNYSRSNKAVKMVRGLLAIGAVLNLLLAAFHITFPLLFNWETDLSSLSNTNRAIFITAHLWIIMILVAVACVSIFAWRDLISTGLGRILLLFIGFLWAIRTFTEVAYFQFGVDGAGWRVALFGMMMIIYWMPMLNNWYNSSRLPLKVYS